MRLHARLRVAIQFPLAADGGLVVEVALYVPKGTDLSVVLAEYPDLWADESPYEEDETLEYWIGSSVDDSDDGDEWLTYDDAVEFCGFCEGAIEDAETMIEGNGGWAQSMLRKKDFGNYPTVSDATLRDWKNDSDRYWVAFERGKQAAAMTAKQ